MGDICTDNRFALIEKYKKELIESTNIETSHDEMAVLDNLLFRLWQMGWLDRLEELERKTGMWEVVDEQEPRRYGCSECKRLVWHSENYCPNCGTKMKE